MLLKAHQADLTLRPDPMRVHFQEGLRRVGKHVSLHPGALSSCVASLRNYHISVKFRCSIQICGTWGAANVVKVAWQG